jgi:hypothetical protein
MPDQYVATDKLTGFEVSVTGEFPEHPDDRMRIARTTTLFTRLMSTLLQRDDSQRRLGFRAIETQLELADALIRQDHTEVQRLVRETLTSMGVGEDQLRELAQRLSEAGGLDPRIAEELGKAFGLDPAIEAESEPADAPQLNPNVLNEIQEAMGPPDEDEPATSDAPASPAESDPLRASIDGLRALQQVREARNVLERLSELLPDPDGPFVWKGTPSDADNARAELDRLDAGLAAINASAVEIDPADIEQIRNLIARMRRAIDMLAPPSDDPSSMER